MKVELDMDRSPTHSCLILNQFPFISGLRVHAGTGYHGKAWSLARLHLIHSFTTQQLCDLCNQLTSLNWCPHLQNGVNGTYYKDSGELD